MSRANQRQNGERIGHLVNAAILGGAAATAAKWAASSHRDSQHAQNYYRSMGNHAAANAAAAHHGKNTALFGAAAGIAGLASLHQMNKFSSKTNAMTDRDMKRDAKKGKGGVGKGGKTKHSSQNGRFVSG